MRKIFITLFFVIFMTSNLYAAQSTIKDSEGYACMGEDRTKRQTEQLAMADAKRKAAEQALTYIQSETHVKDFELQKDLISAYTNSNVRIIQTLESKWDKVPPAIGDCYKVKIKAEVIPDEKAIGKVSAGTLADPSAPLTVKVWTDKKEYKEGDRIKISLQGNRPFFARILYKDVEGKILQLLPNPYRQDNYFLGSAMYEIPSGNDRYELEVNPPFGEESIIVYASVSQLGELNLKAEGGVYLVTTKPKDIGNKTRGIKIVGKGEGKEQPASEFFEEKVVVKTGK